MRGITVNTFSRFTVALEPSKKVLMSNQPRFLASARVFEKGSRPIPIDNLEEQAPLIGRLLSFSYYIDNLNWYLDINLLL